MAERQFKPCTFADCRGRMVLTHQEWEPDPALGQLPGGPLRRSSVWRRDADETHLEDAATGERR